MEARAVQPAGNLSCIAHLRVQQTSVREAVNQNTNRWPRAYRSGHGKSGINLSLQLNAPILCEGPAVETPCDVQNLVTFEIPPRVSLRVPEVLDELVLLRDRARDSAQQGLNSG